MKATWLENGAALTPAELSAQGLKTLALPVEESAYQAPLDALKMKHGYSTQDVVALSPSTEGLDGILKNFAAEHHHTEDEVRFVLEGEGVFDIRSRDDRWMKIQVEAGDLIVVPKGRHHRFALTAQKTIRCVRLFKDPTGWTAHYRKSAR